MQAVIHQYFSIEGCVVACASLEYSKGHRQKPGNLGLCGRRLRETRRKQGQEIILEAGGEIPYIVKFLYVTFFILCSICSKLSIFNFSICTVTAM